MKAQMMHVDTIPGRVLVGPKRLKGGFVRIVSQRNGSGLIERYDQVSGAWHPAPQAISFGEVWSAPDVPKIVGADLNPGSAPDPGPEAAKLKQQKRPR